jgi:GTP cyclohydrolase I
MQVQERLTDQIKTVFKRAKPLGVAVVIEAQHMYADERNTETKFSNNYVFFTGAFEEDKTRREFISLISINLVKFSFQTNAMKNS